jgi:hypothetical protein
MTPRQITITGKTLASIAAIISAFAALIIQLAPTVSPQNKELVLAFGIFLTAIATWLSHHPPKVE